MKTKNKQIKPLNIIIVLTILLAIVLVVYFKFGNKSKNSNKPKDYEQSFVNVMPYFKRLTSNTWKGDYH